MSAAAITHEKVGHTNQGLWKHAGWQLPAYIQHVANDLKSDKVDESKAVRLAIGIVRNWKDGHDGKGGKVTAATIAKAKAAWAEWESLKARAGGGKLKEAAALTVPPPTVSEDDLLVMADRAAGRLRLLEAAALPATGDGAQFDMALVEAAAGIRKQKRPASAAARRENSKAPKHQLGKGEFDASHPRARKGSRTGGEFVQSGSSGALVQAVQAKVQTKADGTFGEKTKRAVMAYQRKYGLKVDGIVGAQTAAALRGDKNAKDVKVGALTARDRQYLGNHGASVAKRVARDGHVHGHKRLREAVAVSAVLDRVKTLEPGEHVMLPDGHAVRHVHTEDARGVYQAGSPDRYSARGGVSWHGDTHTTPEKATAAAFTQSAAHDDPQSVGGPDRYRSYTEVAVGGGRASFRGVNEHGQPLIRRPGSPEPTASTWYAISIAPPTHITD